MAEPQTETSKAVDSKSKGKKSALDDDIGKDFLSSWKSMDDDIMDFSFEPTTKGKKKAFNFDKLDMDFNLDGDFDKFSSFKVDMPDLDFSSPAKKDAKGKEKSNEETNSGKKSDKKDRLAFSFNFNELDDFDFSSSPNKGEKTCKKNQESKAAGSESTDDIDFSSSPNKGEKTCKKNQESKAAGSESSDGFDFSLIPNKGEKSCKKNQESKAAGSASTEIYKIDQAHEDDFTYSSSQNKGEKTCKKKQESNGAGSESIENHKIHQVVEDDCISARLLESRDVSNSETETSQGQPEACNSIGNPCPSKAVPAKGPTPENFVKAQGSSISPEISVDTNAKETYKSSPSPDREISSEFCNQQFLQSSPVNFRSGNNSNPETISDMQAEVCSQGRSTKTSSAPDQNVSEKAINNDESIHENLHTKNSFLLSDNDRDENEGPGGNIPAEIDDNQLVKDDIVLKDVSTASLSTENIDNIAAKEDIEDPTPKLPSVSFDSEPMARKDKEAGTIRSRFFRRPEENRSQLHHPSETVKEVSSFSRKNGGDMHLHPTYEKREDFDTSEARNGRKLVESSKISSQELAKGNPVLLQRENNIGRFSDIRASFAAGAILSGGNKLIGRSSVQDKAAEKVDPVLLRIEKNASVQANPPNLSEKTIGSSAVQANPPNLSEKTIGSSAQTSLNPKLQVPKIDTVQNSKFLAEALKIAKKAPALSSFKSTRSIGPKTDNLSSQKETNSLRKLEQNKDTQGNTPKVVLPVAIAEKQTPKLQSLKRKTFQESNADIASLKPLKRLSQSPIGRRNLTVSSQRVAEKEAQNHKNRMEVSTKNVPCDQLTSGSEVPWKVKLTEMEFSSVMENDDGNVEKAEAYGKELDDMCNMLKKRHEEAKELLVRAIVNNNNLLMLNHPIHKVKINMVQKFAELLIFKNKPT